MAQRNKLQYIIFGHKGSTSRIYLLLVLVFLWVLLTIRKMLDVVSVILSIYQHNKLRLFDTMSVENSCDYMKWMDK